jgi:hypothetical protein
MRHPFRAFGDRLQSELGLRHEEREAIRWAMRHPWQRWRIDTERRRRPDGSDLSSGLRGRHRRTRR